LRLPRPVEFRLTLAPGVGGHRPSEFAGKNPRTVEGDELAELVWRRRGPENASVRSITVACVAMNAVQRRAVTVAGKNPRRHIAVAPGNPRLPDTDRAVRLLDQFSLRRDWRETEVASSA